MRECGYRYWRTVTGKCRTPEAALAKAARRMRGQHRIRVLWVGDGLCWYGPHVVYEGKRA